MNSHLTIARATKDKSECRQHLETAVTIGGAELENDKQNELLFIKVASAKRDLARVLKVRVVEMQWPVAKDGEGGAEDSGLKVSRLS